MSEHCTRCNGRGCDEYLWPCPKCNPASPSYKRHKHAETPSTDERLAALEAERAKARDLATCNEELLDLQRDLIKLLLARVERLERVVEEPAYPARVPSCRVKLLAAIRADLAEIDQDRGGK